MVSLDPPSPSQRQPRFTSPASFFGMSVFRLVVLAFLICQMPHLSNANETGCVGSYDPNKDYFPDKADIDHAEDFLITYHKHYKLVTNERTNETFALHQCGTPAPTSLDPSVKVFSIPLTTCGLTSTVEITFMEMLGMRTKISFVDSPQYICSACLQAMVVADLVEPLSSNNTIKQEQIDAVDGVFVGSKDATQPKFISVSTAQDPGALHRPEWIYFIAVFFNAEAKAKILLDNIIDRYECVSNLAESSSKKPKIAWVNYADYTSWGGGITYDISSAQYKQDYALALGCTPVAPSGGSYANLSDWKAAMVDVDIVIDETYLGDMEMFYDNFELTPNSNFKFIKNGQVWKADRLQNALGSQDWFESAIPNADAVLQDLITIYKPEVGFKHDRVWFRNIFKGEEIVVEDDEDCVNYEQAAVSRASTCLPPTSSPASVASPVVALVASLAALALLA